MQSMHTFYYRARNATCVLFSLLLGLMVFGCGKHEPEVQKDPYVAALEALTGGWESNCIVGMNLSLLGAAPLGITQRSIVTIEGDRLKEISRISSLKCSDVDIEIATDAKYELQVQPASPVHDLKLQIESIHIKPLTEFGAKVLNIAKWCGASDWKVDETRSVIGQIGKEKCFSDLQVSTSAIYAMEGGQLYFDKRPSELASDNGTDAGAKIQKVFYYQRATGINTTGELK